MSQLLVRLYLSGAGADADAALSSTGSVSPGDVLAVRQSEAVLPQQLAHLPPELSLTPEGTAPAPTALCRLDPL